MKSEIVGLITMSCYFMMRRRTVERKVIVGDCSWTVRIYYFRTTVKIRVVQHLLAQRNFPLSLLLLFACCEIRLCVAVVLLLHLTKMAIRKLFEPCCRWVSYIVCIVLPQFLPSKFVWLLWHNNEREVVQARWQDSGNKHSRYIVSTCKKLHW